MIKLNDFKAGTETMARILEEMEKKSPTARIMAHIDSHDQLRDTMIMVCGGSAFESAPMLAKSIAKSHKLNLEGVNWDQVAMKYREEHATWALKMLNQGR